VSTMSDLAIRSNDPQKNLVGYDEEQVQRFAAVIKRVAPWAKGLKNDDIGLAVRRALSMGLDPLNPHEVQIWEDRGTIQFQLSYTLLKEWVRQFHGEHTEPQYYRLTPQQLNEEGLAEDDVAYRVKFIMKDDLEAMREMLALKVFDTQEVKAMFEITGLGVATRSAYNGRYFAPNGRSRSWKVKKRALVDAYRRKFGTPSKSEIEQLRRDLPDVDLDDIEYAAEVAPNAGLASQRALAENKTKQREMNERMSDEDRREAADALYGGGDEKPTAVEGEYREDYDVEAAAQAIEQESGESLLDAVEEVPFDDLEPEPDPALGSGPGLSPDPNPPFLNTDVEEIPHGDTVFEDDERIEEMLRQDVGEVNHPPHWIDDPQTRKRFWAWADEQGLNGDDVHKALGVESVRDYGGDKKSAVVAIETWITEQLEH